MNQQDPEATSQNTTTYNAVCESGPHGLQQSWIGQTRSDFDTAQADANDHNSKWPGHEASVVMNLPGSA